MNTNLLHDIVPALTTPEWKVDVENAGTPDEEWMVCTVDVDADDDGRPVDRGHSVLECVAPVGEPQECDQVRRTLEMLPSLLYMVAEQGNAAPESEAGKKARVILDYIRTGRWDDPAREVES